MLLAKILTSKGKVIIYKMKLILKRYLVLVLVISLSFVILITPGQIESVYAHRAAAEDSVPCGTVIGGEEVKISSRLLELLFGKEEVGKDVVLIPGGAIFGAKIKQNHVSVQSAQDSKDIKSGDKIISLNGERIICIEDIKRATENLTQEEITLECERDGKKYTTKITPKLVDGEYRLGLVLKDGAAGIGTITYIDPRTNSFGGLGHGICDQETGEVIDFTSGKVTGVILSGVKRGEEGKPGELSGLLTDKVSGELYANTECGVFGRLDSIPDNLNLTPVQIAHRDEVHEGEATILSSVKVGSVKEYKIKISEINKSSTGTKSFKIKVTDPTLIAITGGVVKGMSGSPIIQDGKLVGAVTHVMVANPTEGYGIFIENMLNASASTRNELPKAA